MPGGEKAGKVFASPLECHVGVGSIENWERTYQA